MPMIFIVVILLCILISAWVFQSFYRKHIQGQGAIEQKAEIIVLDKQAITIDAPVAGQDTQEYWIYVQKGCLGPKREFQVGVHYFHALEPGDKGTLTYQGDKFLHFAMKR